MIGRLVREGHCGGSRRHCAERKEVQHTHLLLALARLVDHIGGGDSLSLDGTAGDLALLGGCSGLFCNGHRRILALQKVEFFVESLVPMRLGGPSCAVSITSVTGVEERGAEGGAEDGPEDEFDLPLLPTDDHALLSGSE